MPNTTDQYGYPVDPDADPAQPAAAPAPALGSLGMDFGGNNIMSPLFQTMSSSGPAYLQPRSSITPEASAAPAPVSSRNTSEGFGIQPSPMLRTNISAPAGSNIAEAAGQPNKPSPESYNPAGAIATGSALAAFIPVAGPILAGLGTLVSAGVNWYYTSKQQKADENRYNQELAFRDQQVTEEKRRYETNLELTRQQLDEQKRQSYVAESLANRRAKLEETTTKEGIAMKKAEIAEATRINNINMTIQLMMGTMNMFNSQGSRMQDYSFWANKAGK